MAIGYRSERVDDSNQQNIVIISYARGDSAKGKKLYEDLKREGINPWSEEDDILPGQNLEEEVRKAIKKSRYYIVLLSSNSINKRGRLQRYLKNALDKQKEFSESDVYVIPARLDDCDISELGLAEIQYADLFPDWDRGFKRILKTIKIEQIKNLDKIKNQVEDSLIKFEIIRDDEPPPKPQPPKPYSKWIIIGIPVGILIISIIIIASFYQSIANYNLAMSQQAENYTLYKIQQDHDILDKFVNSLYPVYKGLDKVINYTKNSQSIYSHQSNMDVLKNMSVRDSNNKYLVEEAINNDRQTHPPYGILSGDQGKRAFLDAVIRNFNRKFDQNASLAYAFIASAGCWMYMLEPIEKQVALQRGWYPDHPWCPEFESSKNYDLHYATEPYYANTVKDMVSTVMVPIRDSNYPNSQKNVTYIGAALDLEKFVNKFFTTHGLDTQEAKLLLLVTYPNNKMEIYEPLWKEPDGFFKNKNNMQIELHQNSSLNSKDNATLIENLAKFDNNGGANWQPVPLHIGEYAITATSKQRHNGDDDYNYPLLPDNKERSISWEWILMRKSAFPYNVKPVSIKILGIL